MYAHAAPRTLFIRRAVALMALAAVIAVIVAALASATAADQTVVHTQMLKGGTTQVSGYDGGAPRPPLVPVADTVMPVLRDALARFEEIPA